ncbi:NADPH-dependent FMN reductase [Kibdelosporangium phytohabitans]|uniref:ACP phosphodiesterase n=1 Tax=Kibdelosporangium phytohabitans TaxID=860235 RepID=A0A0N9I2S1_9PSEU|nr:NADPH-dependent FMN reductase [Kibdelosporangium phytohabitans]ALG08763.1 ACP phosphodiesterase [Kibdelosporangium phytohabitans]MBE1470114.1 chromate reductase [Kibdelosporangium phytohabitans]
MTHRVGYVVGSLSERSINRRLAKALARLAPHGLELVEIPINELPLYNHDYDGDYPEAGTQLKEAIESSDAILFVTPEYNRSIPGALKNAIDWATRPWGTNSLDGKPAAVIGASIGAISTAVAQQHLKSILAFTNSPVLGQPEAYIQFSDGLITEDGEVTNETTAEFLTLFLTAFAGHIKRNLG